MATTYRYIKFTINAIRGSDASTQLSVFRLLDSSDNVMSWGSATVTSSVAGYSGESASNIIDGSTSTKYCAKYTSGMYIIIDMGSSATVDISVYRQYQWYTANDEYARDPVSWEISASNDGSTWDVLDTITSASITTTRYALAYTGTIYTDQSYYLIESGGVYYTVSSDELVEVTDVSELTAEAFQTYGTEDIPSSDLLITLDSPSVYAWTDGETAVEMTASVTATPSPQIVLSQNIDMSDSSITGIESVDIVSDSSTLFATSFDGGTTWYNYVDSAWVELSESTSGQTYDTIEEIGTTAWAEMATTGTIMFRWVLSSTDNYVTSITINFIN